MYSLASIYIGLGTREQGGAQSGADRIDIPKYNPQFNFPTLLCIGDPFSRSDI